MIDVIESTDAVVTEVIDVPADGERKRESSPKNLPPSFTQPAAALASQHSASNST